MKNTLKSSLLGLAGLVSTVNADSLLQDKAGLGYDDVAYNAENSNTYLAAKNNTIKLIRTSTNTELDSELISITPVALYDAQFGLNGPASPLSSYALLANGDIHNIIPADGTSSSTSTSLNPNYNESTEFVGGASNQADRSEFLAVYDNDAFGQFDSAGNLEFYFKDNNVGKQLIDVEGYVSDEGVFTGVLKYGPNDFVEVTAEDQSGITKKDLPEAGSIRNPTITNLENQVQITTGDLDPNVDTWNVYSSEDLSNWNKIGDFKGKLGDVNLLYAKESGKDKMFYRISDE